MGTLDGKIALVTGAGSGIGRTSAETLAGEGAYVLCVDVGEDGAKATARDVGGTAVAGDVGDPDTWRAVVAAGAAHGGIDVAHLNAGVYGHTGDVLDLPDDVYQRVIGANIGGVILGTRAVVASMRERGGGAIVVTASMAGVVPFPPNPLYTASKHAVVGWVRAMAPVLAGDHITVNAVCPGVVDTPMTVGAAGGLDPAQLPFPLIPPSAIAAAVLGLATGADTGVCLAIWPDRDPVPWDFRGPEQLFV